MAIAFIDSAGASSADTEDVTTAGINTTGATLLVASISSYASPGTTGISDSKGNTWTELANYADTVAQIRMFYAENPTVGAGHTFTSVGGPGNYPTISVAAFSGTAVASVFDAGKENGAASDTPAASFASGSVTPSEDNTLLVTGGMSRYSETPASVDGGFTPVEISNGAGGMGGSIAYLIQTTATAANPAWTLSNSQYGGAAVATFKAAPAAPVYTVIDTVSGFTADGIADATCTMDTTGADLLVVGVGEFDVVIGGSVTVSDSKGNSWTALPTYTEGGTATFTQATLWYSKPTSVGAGHTFTAHYDGVSAYYGFITALAASGSATPALDDETGGEGTGSATLSNGSLTPSANSALLVVTAAGAAFVGTTGFASIDGGFTLSENIAYAPSVHISGALAYLIQTSATAANPEWTANSAGDISSAMAVFAATTGAASSNKSNWFLLGMGR